MDDLNGPITGASVVVALRLLLATWEQTSGSAGTHHHVLPQGPVLRTREKGRIRAECACSMGMSQWYQAL